MMQRVVFSGMVTASRAAGIGLAAVLMLGWAGCGGRRADPPRSPPVTVMSPAPPPAPVRSEPAPPPSDTPPPVQIGGTAAPLPPPPPVRQLPNDDDPEVRDQYGFDGERYLSLLTPEEVDILRLRSRGDTASHLSRFLSAKEKENLRRRAAELTEIGVEPLRIGE